MSSLPITLTQTEDLVATCVQEATGWQAIIIPTQGPKPSNQYLTIHRRLKDIEQHEVYNYREEGDDLIEIQKGECYITFEIIAYGDQADVKISELIKYINSSQRNIAPGQIDPDNIFAGGPLWAYFGSGGIEEQQDISVEFAGKTEPREMVQIHFYANITTEEVIDSFETIDIGVEEGDNDVINFEVTVNK